jgi:hypothetical protein
MDQQPDQPRRARRPPTPASWVKGQSGNPRGRPRRGDALAEAIRERVEPDRLIDVALAIIDSEAAPASVKLQAAQFLAERGYSRPAERTELAVGPFASDDDDDPRLARLSVAQLRQLAEVERRREQILSKADDDGAPLPLSSPSTDAGPTPAVELEDPERSRDLADPVANPRLLQPRDPEDLDP